MKKLAVRLISPETYVNRFKLSSGGIYGWRQQWVA
jgi:hypothetical protein